MPENYFDERIAKSYEAKWPELFEPAVVEPAVGFLAELAGTGDALELGVGTGRIAIPLSRRGVRVHGIDLSPDMIAQLRANPGGDAIGVTVGDFATTGVAGTFTLAYLVRNTIMNLTTQDGQVACFQNVAAHLEPGGCFVIEVGVPGLQRLPPGETVRPFTVTPAHLGFEEYDVATQIAWSHHYWVADGAIETHSAPFRYVWPSELDLMARLAGMTLRERWSDWARAPFTSDSTSHVSVWEKPPPEAVRTADPNGPPAELAPALGPFRQCDQEQDAPPDLHPQERQHPHEPGHHRCHRPAGSSRRPVPPGSRGEGRRHRRHRPQPQPRSATWPIAASGPGSPTTTTSTPCARPSPVPTRPCWSPEARPVSASPASERHRGGRGGGRRAAGLHQHRQCRPHRHPAGRRPPGHREAPGRVGRAVHAAAQQPVPRPLRRPAARLHRARGGARQRGHGRLSAATRADLAEAAAVVLLSDDQAGRVHELGGDDAFSFADLAAAVSEVSGRPVVYRDLPTEQYTQALVGAGLPELLAAVMADSRRGIAQGQLLTTGGDLSRRLGRPTTSMPDAVRAAATTAGLAGRWSG